MLDLNALSTGALLTLNALLIASSGNGHDFGFMEEALTDLRDHGVTRHQFAGYVSGLSFAIEWSENLDDDKGSHVTGIQFKLTDEVIDAEDAIEARVTKAIDAWKKEQAGKAAKLATAVTAPFTLTAKDVDGKPITRHYATAALAIAGGKWERTAGLVNWRTIRYALNGVSITTPTLRAMG
jgi:hypothetical protein